MKKIAIGVEPNGLTAYAGALWVSDHTLGKVVRIDPATNRVTGKASRAGRRLDRRQPAARSTCRKQGP